MLVRDFLAYSYVDIENLESFELQRKILRGEGRKVFAFYCCRLCIILLCICSIPKLSRRTVRTTLRKDVCRFSAALANARDTKQ